MPEYMGMHFPYTKKGRAAYRKAKRSKPSKRRYSEEAIEMAHKYG